MDSLSGGSVGSGGSGGDGTASDAASSPSRARRSISSCRDPPVVDGEAISTGPFGSGARLGAVSPAWPMRPADPRPPKPPARPSNPPLRDRGLLLLFLRGGVGEASRGLLGLRRDRRQLGLVGFLGRPGESAAGWDPLRLLLLVRFLHQLGRFLLHLGLGGLLGLIIVDRHVLKLLLAVGLPFSLLPVPKAQRGRQHRRLLGLGLPAGLHLGTFDGLLLRSSGFSSGSSVLRLLLGLRLRRGLSLALGLAARALVLALLALVAAALSLVLPGAAVLLLGLLLLIGDLLALRLALLALLLARGLAPGVAIDLGLRVGLRLDLRVGLRLFSGSALLGLGLLGASAFSCFFASAASAFSCFFAAAASALSCFFAAAASALACFFASFSARLASRLEALRRSRPSGRCGGERSAGGSGSE